MDASTNLFTYNKMHWFNFAEEIVNNFKKLPDFQRKVKHEHELLSLLWSDESTR